MSPSIDRPAGATAVCYVTDEGFLLPTLISALAVSSQLCGRSADVFIVLAGVRVDAKLHALAERVGISFIPLDPSRAATAASAYWSKTHVPPTALGRFYLGELIPQRYARILYLDGDTLPCADIGALVSYSPPAGCVAAAEDISYFRSTDEDAFAQGLREYFRSNGIDVTRDGYFNSGVLAAERHTWSTLSEESLRYFVDHPRRCRFHDQSAMNAIVAGRRIRLSPRWNYLTYYRLVGLHREISPCLFHFAGGEKPWRGWLYPWLDMSRRYQRAVIDLDLHALPRNKFSPSEQLRVSATALGRHLALHTNYRTRLRRYRRLLRGLLESADTVL
jgi:lipopolysaccharide biosynthesis glycosyltransferase